MQRTEGQSDGRRSPVGSRLSINHDALRVRLPLLPLIVHTVVAVVYAVGMSACEAEGMGSTPFGYPYCLASVMDARWSSKPQDGVRLPGEVLFRDTSLWAV